jgi:hypothetical protein
MMQEVRGKLNPGLLWQYHNSRRRRRRRRRREEEYDDDDDYGFSPTI